MTAIRKGEFVLVREGSGYADRAKHPDIYRLARAFQCTRDGVVRSYRYVDNYESGQGMPGLAISRELCVEVYAVGKQHTRALIDATKGLTRADLTYRDKREAESAIVGMLGITKSPDSELTKRLPADYHLRFN